MIDGDGGGEAQDGTARRGVQREFPVLVVGQVGVESPDLLEGGPLHPQIAGGGESLGRVTLLVEVVAQGQEIDRRGATRHFHVDLSGEQIGSLRVELGQTAFDPIRSGHAIGIQEGQHRPPGLGGAVVSRGRLTPLRGSSQQANGTARASQIGSPVGGSVVDDDDLEQLRGSRLMGERVQDPWQPGGGVAGRNHHRDPWGGHTSDGVGTIARLNPPRACGR